MTRHRRYPNINTPAQVSHPVTNSSGTLSDSNQYRAQFFSQNNKHTKVVYRPVRKVAELEDEVPNPKDQDDKQAEVETPEVESYSDNEVDSNIEEEISIGSSHSDHSADCLPDSHDCPEPILVDEKGDDQDVEGDVDDATTYDSNESYPDQYSPGNDPTPFPPESYYSYPPYFYNGVPAYDPYQQYPIMVDMYGNPVVPVPYYDCEQCNPKQPSTNPEPVEGEDAPASPESEAPPTNHSDDESPSPTTDEMAEESLPPTTAPLCCYHGGYPFPPQTVFVPYPVEVPSRRSYRYVRSTTHYPRSRNNSNQHSEQALTTTTVDVHHGALPTRTKWIKKIPSELLNAHFDSGSTQTASATVKPAQPIRWNSRYPQPNMRYVPKKVQSTEPLAETDPVKTERLKDTQPTIAVKTAVTTTEESSTETVTPTMQTQTDLKTASESTCVEASTTNKVATKRERSPSPQKLSSSSVDSTPASPVPLFIPTEPSFDEEESNTNTDSSTDKPARVYDRFTKAKKSKKKSFSILVPAKVSTVSVSQRASNVGNKSTVEKSKSTTGSSQKKSVVSKKSQTKKKTAVPAATISKKTVEQEKTETRDTAAVVTKDSSKLGFSLSFPRFSLPNELVDLSAFLIALCVFAAFVFTIFQQQPSTSTQS